MKKIMTLLLALAMLFSFAACGGTTTQPTEAPTEASKPALEGTMEEILNKVAELNPVEFMGGTMPIDLADPDSVKYNIGLDSVEGITDAAVYGPMMGSIAFSMVMVRVDENTDAQAVAEAMKAGIDPRKWICVEADDLMIAAYGDVAMLIMVDSTNGLSAQPYVDAFQTVCGAELDFVA